MLHLYYFEMLHIETIISYSSFNTRLDECVGCCTFSTAEKACKFSKGQISCGWTHQVNTEHVLFVWILGEQTVFMVV